MLDSPSHGVVLSALTSFKGRNRKNLTPAGLAAFAAAERDSLRFAALSSDTSKSKLQKEWCTNQLEDVLGQINGNGSSIHFRLLLSLC